jgi:hypothetical protein
LAGKTLASARKAVLPQFFPFTHPTVSAPLILQQSLDRIVESFQAHWGCFEMLR